MPRRKVRSRKAWQISTSGNELAEAWAFTDSDLRFADKCLEVLKHLALRGSAWPNACAVAIRNLKNKTAKKSDSAIRTDNEAKSGPSSQDSRTASRPEAAPKRKLAPRSSMSSTSTAPLAKRRPTISDSSGLQSGASQSFHGRQFSAGSTGQNGQVNSADFAQLQQQGQSQTISINNGSSSYADIGGLQQWNPMPTQTAVSQSSGSQAAFGNGSDLFYGSDIPFWMGDDQWNGLPAETWTWPDV
jgi:hypothetical protein